MGKYLRSAMVACLLSGAASAFAKPNSTCEALLNHARAVIEAQNILAIEAYGSIFFLMSGTDTLRSNVGAHIRREIGKTRSAGAFMGVELEDAFYDKAVHDPDELLDKRTLARFETDEFLLIDNLEAFVFDFGGRRVNEANLARLRESLTKRIGTRRPTLILVNDPSNVNRFLRGLR